MSTYLIRKAPDTSANDNNYVNADDLKNVSVTNKGD